jgi:two-component system capsular synthesis sensor histidine kinase RcsC
MQRSHTKGLPARNAAPDSSNDPDVLQRYRKLTLWAAIIISAVPVVVCALTLTLFVKEFIAEQYAEFIGQAAKMQLAFTRRETWVRISVMYEQSVAPRIAPDRALLAQLQQGHGVLSIRHGANPIQMDVYADLSDPADAARYAFWLALADDYLDRGGAYLKWLGTRLSFTGYMFSPDRKFIVIMRAPQTPNGPRSGSYAQAYAKLQKAVPPGLAGGDLHWLPPRPDPLTGEPSIEAVQAVSMGGAPLLILGSTLPLAELEAVVGKARPGEVAGLAIPGADRLFGAEPRVGDHLAMPAALRALPPLDARLGKPELQFVGAHVLVRSYLDGPGWTFLRYFSFATLLSELSSSVLLNVLATAFVVLLTWITWLWLERKVFAPGRQQSRLIYESEQLNRAIVSLAPAGIALLDRPSGAVLLQNDAAAGYAARAQAAQIPLLQRAVAGYGVRQPLEGTPPPQTQALTFEDGHGTLDLQVTVVPARYQGADALLCSFTDITAQKDVERALAQARDAADAANRAKSAFFAATSHEIRTPLNVILGNLELLNRSRLSAFQTQRLQAVTSATSLLLGIVNDILDFSKMETGQLELEAIPFDLAGLAHQISAAFAPMAAAKGLRFEESIDPSLAPRYIGDPTRIRQMIFNLVSNAIKFTGHGEVALEVYPRGDAPDSPVGIAVTDTGIGIAPEHQAQLFRPFTQADPSISRRYGGTGLGLAICARLAQLMNGGISLDSAPGVGSAFTLELPLRAAPPADPDVGERDAGAPAHPPRLHLLVVDDNAANRELIRLQLHELGHEVELAVNGLDALQRFGGHPFDLVLTDVSMPVMDGPEFARRLRAQGVDVPLVAVTAHVDPAEHERCRACGINAVLVRPLLIDELDRLIRQLIRAGGRDAGARAARVDMTRGVLPAPVFTALRDTFTHHAAQIREAATNAERDRVLRELHTVKGAFAMIHEHAFVRRCEDLEHLAREGALDAVCGALDVWERDGADVLMRRSGTQ